MGIALISRLHLLRVFDIVKCQFAAKLCIVVNLIFKKLGSYSYMETLLV